MLPAVHGRLGPVAGPVHLQEGVPGAVVGVELIGLSSRLERVFEFSDVLGRGVLILGAEQATAQTVRGPLDQAGEPCSGCPSGGVSTTKPP